MSCINKNYGINYAGPWVHPLSPYNYDLKESKPPLPLHGQQGGINYRHWLGLAAVQGNSATQPARVVSHYLGEKVKRIKAAGEARLWAFGFDMDNMKARCWYDSIMPVYPIPEKRREFAIRQIHDLIEASVKVAQDTRKAIKKAWFRRPKDHKGDLSFVDQAFWQNTEIDFYDSLYNLIHGKNSDGEVAALREKWANKATHQAFQLFDQYALAAPMEDADMKRVVKARNELGKWAGGMKKKLTDKKNNQKNPLNNGGHRG